MRAKLGPELEPPGLLQLDKVTCGNQEAVDMCMCVHGCAHMCVHGCVFLLCTHICPCTSGVGGGVSRAFPLTSPFSTKGFTSARSTSCSSRDMALLSPACTETEASRSAIPGERCFQTDANLRPGREPSLPRPAVSTSRPPPQPQSCPCGWREVYFLRQETGF